MHLKTKEYLNVISSILSQDKFLSSDITHERKTKCCLEQNPVMNWLQKNLDDLLR